MLQKDLTGFGQNKEEKMIKDKKSKLDLIFMKIILWKETLLKNIN